MGNVGEVERVGEVNDEAEFKKYLGTIYKWALKVSRDFGMEGHLEDMVQEGALAWVLERSRYRGDKGANFNTYFTWQVRGRLSHYVERNLSAVSNLKGQGRRQAVWRGEVERDFELDVVVSGDLQGESYLDKLVAPDGIPERLVGEEEWRLRVREVLEEEVRTPLQRAIVDRRLLSDPPERLKEVAGRFGCSKNNVWLVEGRLKERLVGRLAGELHDGLKEA